MIFIDLTFLNTNMVTKLLHHTPLARERDRDRQTDRERPLKSKTTFVVKYICASAETTRKVYCGLGTRIGRDFTGIWDKYEGRPRFFNVP